MPIALHRRGNGRPIRLTLSATGLASGQVSALTPQAPTAMTIPVTYTAPTTGTAPISYAGQTSPHGTGTWSANTGTFTATGGTFVGLMGGTNYDLRVVATNLYGSSTTDYLVGVATVSSASRFSLACSASSGSPGAPVTLTVTPTSGPWPSGEVITPAVAGLSGSFDNASLVGSGTAPVVFTFAPSGSGTGTLSASAPGMTNSSGPQSYTVNPVTASSTANRYDIVAASSAGPTGSAVTHTLYPNGNWPSGSITLAPATGSGTFSPSATVTPAAGTNTPVSVQYTPTTAGEHLIKATNTAGMFNPYGAPLNVFSPSSGTARTIAANLRFLDLGPHQRDTASGNPAGFSFPWARGWGEVWIDITSLSGATDGLWIKLYDALSAGASGTPGSGTALNAAPVQVYGAVSTAGRVRVLLPAGPYIYYAEIATNAGFSAPVRIQQRFSVGVVLALDSRSQNNGVIAGYQQSAPPGLGYVNCVKTVGFYASDARYGALYRPWYRLDGVSSDPDAYNEPSSTGGMELGRLIESQLGVTVGVVGCAAVGWGIDTHINSDGSMPSAWRDTVAAGVPSNKFRYFWSFNNGWDGPALTYADFQARLLPLPGWVAQTYPACAAMTISCSTGQFGDDGSNDVGYTRTTLIVRDQVEPANPMVVARDEYDWNGFVSGHSSWLSRMHYVRQGFRDLMDAELAAFGGFQTTAHGPRLGSAGTFTNTGSGVRIAIPYTLHGGRQLVGRKWSEGASADQYVAVNAYDLAALFGVYPGDGRWSTTRTVFAVSGVTWDASNIYLQMDNSHPGLMTDRNGASYAKPSSFTVHFGSDFGISGGTYSGSGYCVALDDDQADAANGIPYGRRVRVQLDIAVSAA